MIYTDKKMTEIKELAIQPYKDQVTKLKQELEAERTAKRELELKIKQQNEEYKRDFALLEGEHEKLNRNFHARESNMKDMLDRFASKNFVNGQRNSYNHALITDWRRIRLRKGYREVIGFTVLFPFPTRNHVEDVERITEDIEKLVPDIAKEIGIDSDDSIEFISASIKNNGWLAKFEAEL